MVRGKPLGFYRLTQNLIEVPTLTVMRRAPDGPALYAPGPRRPGSVCAGLETVRLCVRRTAAGPALSAGPDWPTMRALMRILSLLVVAAMAGMVVGCGGITYPENLRCP